MFYMSNSLTCCLFVMALFCRVDVVRAVFTPTDGPALNYAVGTCTESASTSTCTCTEHIGSSDASSFGSNYRTTVISLRKGKALLSQLLYLRVRVPCTTCIPYFRSSISSQFIISNLVPRNYCNEERNPTNTMDGLWDGMAEELVALIADHLAPSCLAIQSEDTLHNTTGLKRKYALESIGAAHWVQLSSAMLLKVTPWLNSLSSNRRSHHETAACCRVLELRDTMAYDWPLMVLRLRCDGTIDAESANQLSHATPISRHTLRAAYWAVSFYAFDFSALNPVPGCLGFVHVTEVSARSSLT